MMGTNFGSEPGSFVLGSLGEAQVIAATPDGTYVVSFDDITPPARYDSLPWTTVQIQQSLTLAGPWTLIDTQTFPGPDTDPTNPAARAFTTSLATTQEGFFTLTFIDSNGGSSQPLMQVMNQPSEIRPTVGELGSFMRARTVAAGSGGNELGTFTSATRPTAVEADALIDQAVSAVLMQTGADVPDRFITQTKFAVLLYAAMLVELTFYRNEVNRDQSAYAQYEQLYQQTCSALLKAIADEDPASPEAAFFSVPIINSAQARFQFISKAFNTTTGTFDPTLLPPDLYFPNGVGGIPPELYQILPWLGLENPFGFDVGLAWLEAPD